MTGLDDSLQAQYRGLVRPTEAVELVGEVDQQHRLHGVVPASIPAGRVRVIVIVPDEDEAGAEWEAGIAREWAAEFADIREDIYTVADGEPEDGIDLQRRYYLAVRHGTG